MQTEAVLHVVENLQESGQFVLRKIEQLGKV